MVIIFACRYSVVSMRNNKTLYYVCGLTIKCVARQCKTYIIITNLRCEKAGEFIILLIHYLALDNLLYSIIIYNNDIDNKKNR